MLREIKRSAKVDGCIATCLGQFYRHMTQGKVPIWINGLFGIIIVFTQEGVQAQIQTIRRRPPNTSFREC